MHSLLRLSALTAFLTITASAQIDVKMYRQAMLRPASQQERVRTYLAGAGQAFGTANANLKAKHQALLYCAPGGLTLNIDNLIPIINDWIQRMSNGTSLDEIDKLPVVSVLLEGLIDTFPCPGSS